MPRKYVSVCSEAVLDIIFFLETVDIAEKHKAKKNLIVVRNAQRHQKKMKKKYKVQFNSMLILL